MAEVDINLVVRTQRNVEQRDDYDWIKKNFGERFAKRCRTGDMFARILEQKGALSHILEEHFHPSKNLYDDLTSQNAWERFKAYIYNFYDVEVEHKQKNDIEVKSAVDLMGEAGYILYPECQTEEEIQSFRHYYYRGDDKKVVYRGGMPEQHKGEELCTFNGDRLITCRVWFAVKKDVDQISRDDFLVPSRQDGYGTSVISIQFSRGENQTLSIKNRYNHTVNNPDNTFNSDLENIIPGLSDAFERDYGVRDSAIKEAVLELNGYVSVGGKFYKYNHEINNVYYCENNMIIDNFEIKQLPSHVILADYFIFDPKEKTVKLYDKSIADAFAKSFENVERIDYNKKEGKITVKVQDGKDIVVMIDDLMRITGLTNENIEACSGKFLYNNRTLKELNMPNLQWCGGMFLNENRELKQLNLPKLEICKNDFLRKNKVLEELNIPNLKSCGDGFLSSNEKLQRLNVPNLESCGDDFLSLNENIEEANLSNLKNCGVRALKSNDKLKVLDLRNLEECGSGLLFMNKSLEEVDISNLYLCDNIETVLYFHSRRDEFLSNYYSQQNTL